MIFFAQIKNATGKTISAALGDTAEEASYKGFAREPKGVTSFVTGHDKGSSVPSTYENYKIKKISEKS